MTMKKYPDGYPLDPKDSEGNVLKEGDNVIILHIPDSLIHDLEKDAQKAIKSCEGQIMNIYEVDDYGFMWVEKPTLETEDMYESHSFSMEPKYLLKV
jgi:hypothetical protein